MKKTLLLFILFGLICPLIFEASSIAYSAEIQNRSSENIIFERVKSGIVTVLGASSGSGFLIDNNGLILTNYHVVKDQEGTLRVRFDKGLVLKADIVEVSPQDDLAIIRVNMKALKYKPYVFSVSNNNEVYVGQRVITIGSPIDFMVFDKTLTQGVVSKIDPKVIYHDIAINGGNSGSPLISLNGEALGVNTFIRSDRGQPLAGAIDIKKAIKLLNNANQKIAQLPPPSAQLYPDFPSEPYTHNIMNKTFKTEKELDKLIWHTQAYSAKGKTYIVSISTPLQRYKSQLIISNELREKAKRSLRNNYEQEFDPVGDNDLPYIIVVVAPDPDMTAGSRTKLISCMIVPFTGPIVATLQTYRMKFKSKLDSVSFIKNGQKLQPFSEGKIYIDNQSFSGCYGGTVKRNIVDKDAYYYLARYDYKYFDTSDELYFEIKSKNKQEVEKIVIPEKIKEKIRTDMKPYVDSLKK